MLDPTQPPVSSQPGPFLQQLPAGQQTPHNVFLRDEKDYGIMI